MLPIMSDILSHQKLDPEHVAMKQSLWEEAAKDVAVLIHLAAGFDKNGDYLDALGALGFSHVELGTVTPRPQDGNPPFP